MNQPARPGFSLRDLIAQIRRRFPWPPVKPPIVRPDSADVAADRVRTQVDIIRKAFPEAGVAVAGSELSQAPKDDADGSFLYRPGYALVRDNTDKMRYYEEFTDFFTRRDGLFDGEPVRERDLSPGLVLVRMPGRSDERNVLVTLDEIDKDRREKGIKNVLAQPDHILYVTTYGRLCPATEPQEPRRSEPVPARSTDDSAGAGVRVSVVDTGLWVQATSNPETDWLVGVTPADHEDIENVNSSAIHAYAGHGTFVAGIIRCVAPRADIEVEGALPNGGAVYESELCEELREALRDRDDPQLISVSAGTYTLNNLGLLGFEILAETHGLTDGTKGLIVAAAGNDGTDDRFYPAAFDWVVAVGAVEQSGDVCDFSNYGKWVDVWARGRDLINAFPEGTYTCYEPPNKGQVRNFKHLAQWSGTSFATPIVTGAIAAHMSATGNLTEPRKAFDELFQAAASATPGPDGKPIIGPL